MARQFKVEAKYPGPPIINAELYWHDDNNIEFVTIPPNVGPNTLIGRTELLTALVDYMKREKVNQVIVTKVVVTQLLQDTGGESGTE